jgi:hypothetical protein
MPFIKLRTDVIPRPLLSILVFKCPSSCMYRLCHQLHLLSGPLRFRRRDTAKPIGRHVAGDASFDTSPCFQEHLCMSRHLFRKVVGNCLQGPDGKGTGMQDSTEPSSKTHLCFVNTSDFEYDGLGLQVLD